MAEVNALELQERSAAPTRQHKIVLCCAQSVHAMVEEVAHNLAGLGFRSRVVCGAEARAALLGRDRDAASRDEPTIYVVCVQGTLKEQVLQPLRQALATHGGPNEHLFVAVLDLTLPLAMVGQIRRFADALERMPGRRRRDAVADRRQWREHFGRREIEGLRTRAHMPLHVVERASTRPGVTVAKPGDRVTGPRRIVTGRQPARIAPTKKYRAVTGVFGVVPEPAQPRPDRRRARTRKPRRPMVPASAARAKEVSGAIEAKGRPSGVEIGHPSKRPAEAPPGGEVKTGDRVETPAFGAAITPSGGARRWLGLGGLVVLVAGAVWVTGLGEDLLARLGSDGGHGTAAASRPAELTETAQSPAPSAESSREREMAPAKVIGGDEPAGDEPMRDEPVAAVVEDEAIDEAHEDDEVDEDDEIEASAAGEARPGTDVLEELVTQSRLRKVRNLFVSSRQGRQTTWEGARNRCRQLQIAGVEGWRLPHRRELKLLDVAGYLTPELTFWSYTRVEDDPDSAYVLDTKSRNLVQYLTQEPTGDVVCVWAH